MLLEKIREILTASPFYREGHRKVWARLRFQRVRTSKARVLRLMREAQLLAPSRMFPNAENLHTGTILTARPNVHQPECNGWVERFIRTLKEQLLWVRVFQNVEELRCALAEFRERYNQRWIVQRLGHLTPAQTRQQLLALEAAA